MIGVPFQKALHKCIKVYTQRQKKEQEVKEEHKITFNIALHKYACMHTFTCILNSYIYINKYNSKKKCRYIRTQ